MDLERLYAHLPIFLQNAAVSAQGLNINRWRYGGEFERLLAECIKRQSFDSKALRVYQGSRLREVLKSAAHTPFGKSGSQNTESILVAEILLTKYRNCQS